MNEYINIHICGKGDKVRLRRTKKIILIGVIILGILGFGALSVKQINEEQSFAAETIDKINVDVTTETVQISQSETGGNVMVYLTGKKMMQEVRLSTQIIEGVLTIGIERDRKLPEDTTLTINLPNDFTKNLDIHTTMGVVKIDSVTLNSFILNTNSGGMKAQALSADNISVTTTSGSIKAVKLEAKKLDIQGKTASVKIDECLTKSAQIETTTGGITLRLPDTAEFSYKAKTSTGKLSSDFPVNTVDSKKITGQIGAENNRVILQTSTGSISLLKNS
jgi:DUF4097 and DUF4098 domain-containing protein YvlB